MAMNRSEAGHGPARLEDHEIGDDIVRMNAEDVRRVWSRELRLTTLLQGVGHLRKWDRDANQYRYDALGILLLVCMDLEIEDITDEEWAATSIPYRTAEMVGLKCDEENGVAVGGEVELIERMNDRGESFSTIARAIDRRDFTPLYDDEPT
jgi:hypothetical protein